MKKTQHNALNVEVIDEAFFMPQLQRERRIWIYKPFGYYRNTKRFPVIYMQDGQNLFDDATAFNQEWGIDETLNSLLAECIVVGIDNSEHRMTEYNFNDNEENGLGEGKKYAEFIVRTLKPAIDLNFRTKPERKFTHIAGSSMGGFISLYIALAYPATFAGAGVFSPSLWIAKRFRKEIAKMAELNVTYPQQFYIYGGAKEGVSMIKNIDAVANVLERYPLYFLKVDIDPEGEHSEYYWRNKFPDYFKWIMSW